MKKRKENKGITLIALVITIIVLLILTGITLYLTIGDNGIIGKAQQSGQNYLIAQEQELEGLNELDNHIVTTARGESNSGGIVDSGTSDDGRNGYIKFSNGLIMQWGYVTRPAVSGSNTITMQVQLPIAFTKATYNIQITKANMPGYAGMVEETVYGQKEGSFGIAIANNSNLTSGSANLMWQAIGY